jgi:hypothetical protein
MTISPESWKKEALRAVLYASWTHASHTDRLCDFLYADSTFHTELSMATSPYNAIDRTLAFAGSYVPRTIETDRDAILAITCSKIAADDRRNIAKIAQQFTAAEDVTPERYLDAQKQKSIRALKGIGLKLSNYPELLIVDEYPRPFQHLKGTALAPDQTDQKRFGLPNAIYFLKSAFSPVSTALVIPHELVHAFVDDNGLLARGLEEGLADFVSLCVLGPRLLPERYILNWYSSRRLGLDQSAQKFRAYAGYLRRAYLYYLINGEKRMVDLIRIGRAAIKTAETRDFFGGIKTAQFTLFRRLATNRIASELCLNAQEHEHLSPSAYALMMTYAGTLTCDFDKQLKERALLELEQSIFVLLRGEGQSIEFNDSAHVAYDRWCRFRVQGT